MSNDASQESARATEQRVVWFLGGERPVGGGGNTVFVRPADLDETAVTPTVAIELQ